MARFDRNIFIEISEDYCKIDILLCSFQVNVVHIDAISKNAADDKLRQNIRRFADIYSPPASIVLISSKIIFIKFSHQTIK